MTSERLVRLNWAQGIHKFFIADRWVDPRADPVGVL